MSGNTKAFRTSDITPATRTHLRMWRTCPVCFGSGRQQIRFRDFGALEEAYIPTDFQVCPRCHGTGTVPNDRDRRVF